MMVAMLKKKTRETFFQCCRVAERGARKVPCSGYRESRVKEGRLTWTGAVGLARGVAAVVVEAERAADMLFAITVGDTVF